MHWIALKPSRDEERQAWGWRALQITPRVAAVEEALLLEVSASERLFGGRKAISKFLGDTQGLAPAEFAWGSSALVALALLRMQCNGEARPRGIDAMPLTLMTAAAGHLATLSRVGCNTWGELRALPRGGVARRFGAGLLAALDAAYGDAPESHDWLTLPEVFDLRFELAALATSAPELMWTAQRLLSQLQVWLQSRNLGVLAVELEWTLDLRRHNGVELPPVEQLQVRTAQPTQDMAHLRRLVNEHLTRTPLSAPANHLRLRSLETQPWGGEDRSFLPEDNVQGERLHQLVERLSVRLGAGNVVVPVACADWRPERMQEWVPAREHAMGGKPGETPRGASSNDPPHGDALYPTWLLPQPVALEVFDSVPHYGGPLKRLRMYRVETGWWEEGRPALRDYFIARSERAGWVWVYRVRPAALGAGMEAQEEYQWYLQGVYA